MENTGATIGEKPTKTEGHSCLDFIGYAADCLFGSGQCFPCC